MQEKDMRARALVKREYARDSHGRFQKGNPGGPGNPYAERVAELRSMILDAVTKENLRAVVKAMVKRAKGGDVVAARELFNRLVGKASVIRDTGLDDEEPEFRAADVVREYYEQQALEEARSGNVPKLMAPTAEDHSDPEPDPDGE